MEQENPPEIAEALEVENGLIQQAVRQHLEQRVVALNVQNRQLVEQVADLETRLAKYEAPEQKEDES